jgi:broad specificity phosphatase PhoE
MAKSTIEKTVYFVRHGQSEANASGNFQFPETPLTEKGREQAGRVAERVARLEFETLISSPYVRAQQTAQAITNVTNKPAELSDLFVERVKPSSIDGKTIQDENAVALYKQWEDHLYIRGERVEDGENYDDIVARAEKALRFLEAKEENNIVVVTHGFFLRVIILCAVFGDTLTPENFKHIQHRMVTKNSGLTVLNYVRSPEGVGYWRLWVYNDHSHLG